MLCRKIGPGTLRWGGGSIAGGEVKEVPRHVAERYAHKLEFFDGSREPHPTVLDPDRVRPPEGLEVSEYHIGGGWYELPGHEGRVRRAEALRLTGRG